MVVRAGGGGGDGGTAGLDGPGIGAVLPCSIGVGVGAGDGGTAGLDGPGTGAVLPCSIGVGEEVFSAQRVQVVIVLVIKLVFTMMEVLPLTTVVEVTGQLVTVV